jgi:hypothetical protein
VGLHISCSRRTWIQKVFILWIYAYTSIEHFISQHSLQNSYSTCTQIHFIYFCFVPFYNTFPKYYIGCLSQIVIRLENCCLIVVILIVQRTWPIKKLSNTNQITYWRPWFTILAFEVNVFYIWMIVVNNWYCLLPCKKYGDTYLYITKMLWFPDDNIYLSL